MVAPASGLLRWIGKGRKGFLHGWDGMCMQGHETFKDKTSASLVKSSVPMQRKHRLLLNESTCIFQPLVHFTIQSLAQGKSRFTLERNLRSCSSRDFPPLHKATRRNISLQIDGKLARKLPATFQPVPH